MGKQTFDRRKNKLAILVVFFVIISMTITAVSATDEIKHPHQGGHHPSRHHPSRHTIQADTISTTGMTTTITTITTSMTTTTMVFTTRTMSGYIILLL
jgi:hypothetical protein